MKKRISVTIDSQVAKRAKQIADGRKTSVSAVIEDAVRSTPVPTPRRRKRSGPSFAEKWTGKLRLRTSSAPDPLLDALKAKYGLSDE